jgi:hypothetical protein
MVDAYGDEEWGDYGDENAMDWQPSQTTDIPGLKQQNSIQIMKLEDIKPNVESRVREYCDLFGLDEDKMYLVAKFYRWN